MGAIYYDDKLFSGAIDNIISCTLAEYQALSPAEKNNGRVYMITDQNVNGLDILDLRYNNLISKLSSTNVQDAIDELAGKISHIGMIIQSTTLDTEAKVKAIYGGNKWIQHDGYILRGASSGVVANSAVKTGGEDTHILTTEEMPSHTHTQNAHSHGYNRITQNGDDFGVYGGGGQGGWGLAIGGTNNNYGRFGIQNATATNQNTGGGQAHNNMQSYKSVYIWERTE